MYVISYDEAEYPQKLKQYKKAPRMLYCEGDISLLNNHASVTFAGTRYPSEFIQKYTFNLSAFLASNKIIIYSGLAEGVDTEAHQGAIVAKGKTVAVLGSTLDNIYPKKNRDLAAWIVESGGLLVTAWNEDRYDPSRFPERDYHLACMTDAVIPMQMSKRIKSNKEISYGGTQYAVTAAKEYGRMLFVPRPVKDDQLQYPDKYEGIEKIIEQGNMTGVIEHHFGSYRIIANMILEK